jgi:cysteinyl-tRNA synthetase
VACSSSIRATDTSSAGSRASHARSCTCASDRAPGARKRKDFKESNRIREYLLGKGIVLEDSAKGVSWKRKG